MRISNYSAIESSVIDAKIISSLGLIKKFQITDMTAQQAGHPKGEITLTEPNKALFDHSYTYYVQVGGKQFKQTITPEHFRSYTSAVHDLTNRLTVEAERAFHKLSIDLDYFLDQVQGSLPVKLKSPSLLALENLSGKEELSKETVVLQNPSFDICHYSDMLLADLNDQPVPLGHASLLYQPIKGTSSTYYLVARTTIGISLAAKFTPNGELKLMAFSSWHSKESERVIHKLLSDFGFSAKEAGHFGVVYKYLTASEAQRALYALLTVFEPEELQTGLPQIHDFKG